MSEKQIFNKKVVGPEDFTGMAFTMQSYGNPTTGYHGVDASVKISDGYRTCSFEHYLNRNDINDVGSAVKFWEQVGENANKFATMLREQAAQLQKQAKEVSKSQAKRTKTQSK